MTTAAITFSGVFWDRLVIVDVLVFIALVVIEWLTLSPLTKNVPEASTDPSAIAATRGAAASSMGVAAGAGITAVGILVPLTLFTVSRLIGGNTAFRQSVTADLFVAECWFALSLAIGLFVLWLVAFKAPTRNVTRTGYITLVFTIQLFALLLGLVRVLVATFNLVGR